MYDPGGALSSLLSRYFVLIVLVYSFTCGLKADCGDYVVVTNARKIRVSGNKEQQKVYYSHSMYPGGLKERKFKDLIVRKPEDVSTTILHFHALCSCIILIPHFLSCGTTYSPS